MGSAGRGDWNEQVRRLADNLSGSAETKFGFTCQCGCGTVVPLTSRNFDANGAWADGHGPATGWHSGGSSAK
jgi:prepilin-type processing-associated H-X9-DG protein